MTRFSQGVGKTQLLSLGQVATNGAQAIAAGQVVQVVRWQAPTEGAGQWAMTLNAPVRADGQGSSVTWFDIGGGTFIARPAGIQIPAVYGAYYKIRWGVQNAKQEIFVPVSRRGVTIALIADSIEVDVFYSVARAAQGGAAPVYSAFIGPGQADGYFIDSRSVNAVPGLGSFYDQVPSMARTMKIWLYGPSVGGSSGVEFQWYDDAGAAVIGGAQATRITQDNSVNEWAVPASACQLFVRNNDATTVPAVYWEWKIQP